ncbi:MAG: WYL domain-containing protein [candidate division Zixibacteria bacterium]|nr:WYL domain-containing protein [candidate division Zixibacteria bacterium]
MIDEKTEFIAFDTETTGLSASDGFIVEIAALKFNLEGIEIDSFSELVKPPIKMPEIAYRIHKISDEMVADKPTIEEVLPRFIDYFTGEKNVLIAQNSVFDIGFVNYEAKRYQLRLPKNCVLDQIDLTRRAFPKLPGYALEKTCKRFDLIDIQTHRAMADAVLVKKLFLHCMKNWETVEQRLAILNSLPHFTFGGPMIVTIDRGLVEVINVAIEAGKNLEIVYNGGSHKGRSRPITPTFIYNRDGMAYLAAKCLMSNAGKQFRIDRIVECRPAK